jgi:hypothetical protein
MRLEICYKIDNQKDSEKLLLAQMYYYINVESRSVLKEV